ncbi:MAG: DUF933 domain-containing protein [Candidatus Omnitrophota bacterium]|nr:DUF933 domain-containing protein [Candidatus Omnitrophota bacterium]
MKVSTFGLDIEPGKYKYKNVYFDKLVEKFLPGKTTPYTIEFLEEDFDKTDAVVFDINKKFDFVFIDLEKIDKRLSRAESDEEKKLLDKVKELLEKETLLCDAEFSESEHVILKPLAPVTYKPSVGVSQVGEMNELITKIIEKSGVVLFFTAGKKEVRAWDIKKGQSILEAAGRIHSDLARGFIKADVVNCDKLDDFFNMTQAKAKGLVKLVDRDYIMSEGDIIEIRFNV